MRITNNMMISKMMQNLNANMLRLDKRQMQMASGKKFQVASDDPIAVSRTMKIKADLSELDQYKKNIDDAISFLETTELAVKSVGDALQRLRELVGQAANGVLTDEDELKMKNEVAELKEQIVSLGNSTYSGKYIFSGKKTDMPLFTHNGTEYEYNVGLSSADIIHFQVGVNETISINCLGFSVFDNTPGPVAAGAAAGIVGMINDIMTQLNNAEYENLSGSLADIDTYLNINLTARSEIGAKINRMELVQERIADDKINYSKLRTQLEDADMAETIMQLMNEENVYNASLSVGARIIQPTLLDFLR